MLRRGNGQTNFGNMYNGNYGVSTRMSVAVAQHYMLRSDFLDAKEVDDFNVAFDSIQDCVATFRNACSPASAKFWWPSEQLRFMQTIAVALHYAHPMQYVAIENAAPEPEWAASPVRPAVIAEASVSALVAPKSQG